MKDIKKYIVESIDDEYKYINDTMYIIFNILKKYIDFSQEELGTRRNTHDYYFTKTVFTEETIREIVEQIKKEIPEVRNSLKGNGTGRLGDAKHISIYGITSCKALYIHFFGNEKNNICITDYDGSGKSKLGADGQPWKFLRDTLHITDNGKINYNRNTKD